MVEVQTLSMTLILALSLPFGTGGVGIADLSLIGVAALGILGWALSDEPVVATTFGSPRMRRVALMLPKTWRDPCPRRFPRLCSRGPPASSARLRSEMGREPPALPGVLCRRERRHCCGHRPPPSGLAVRGGSRPGSLLVMWG